MARITMYTTDWCGYCVRAKALLDARKLEYEERLLDERDPGFREFLVGLSGSMTVPQIVIDDTPIGGYNELVALDRSGRLAELLAA